MKRTSKESVGKQGNSEPPSGGNVASRKVSATTAASPHPKALTMDHIVPIARGGRSTKSNVVPACKTCNNAKKQLLPMEWEEYLEGFG